VRRLPLFPREPRATVDILGQIRRQDLDRDLAIEAGVLGGVDLPHPTEANRLDDPVMRERLTGS
jgi:hypothetical protein